MQPLCWPAETPCHVLMYSRNAPDSHDQVPFHDAWDGSPVQAAALQFPAGKEQWRPSYPNFIILGAFSKERGGDFVKGLGHGHIHTFYHHWLVSLPIVLSTPGDINQSNGH